MMSGGGSRPDDLEPLIITIDGPAGTGKSTAGRELANRLGLEFLDTGAMYRAATALVIDERIDPNDEAAVASAVEHAEIRFDWTTDPPTILSHGHPLRDRLRESDIAELISTLAAQAPLRDVLVRRQRAIGIAHPRLVTEGRDQGSIVFPNAQVKIYMHASARIRAERRASQLAESGKHVNVDDIESELVRRDERDASRAVGPLVRPDGAIDVDTSSLSFDESIDELESIVRTHAPEASLACASSQRGHG